MPRWEEGRITKRTCPVCGKHKDFYALACRECRVYPKTLLGKKGSEHPTWKGGHRLDADGYIKTYAPNHPFPRRGGYVYEHVRIMELKLGRRLLPTESVHHVNHDKQDNSESNLVVLQRGQHSAHHRQLDTHTRIRDANGRFAPNLH